MTPRQQLLQKFQSGYRLTGTPLLTVKTLLQYYAMQAALLEHKISFSTTIVTDPKSRNSIQGINVTLVFDPTDIDQQGLFSTTDMFHADYNDTAQQARIC